MRALFPIRHAFLASTLLILGSAWWVACADIDAALAHLTSDESQETHLGKGALMGRLEAAASDVRFLSHHSTLREAIRLRTPAALGRLSDDFEVFARSKRIYNQIRWIDESGMERIRVDFDGKTSWQVSGDQLQNKGDRYFFTDTVKLPPGTLFVSPLDLNIEGKAIELPYKPMIRLATPLQTDQGKPAGILIINYFGQDLLSTLQAATSERIQLLNAQGYWLSSPNPEDCWGFMFRQPDKTLGARHPEAWHHISASAEGQIELRDGLWSWNTLTPLQAGQISSTGTAEAAGPSAAAVEKNQYIWKIVSHQPARIIGQVKHRIILQTAAMALIFFGLLLFFAIRLGHAWEKRLKAEKNLQVANDALHDAIDELDRSNRELSQQLNRFRVIIDVTSDSFVVMTAQGQLVEYNLALPKLLKLPDADSRVHNLTEFFPGKRKDELLSDFAETLRKKSHRWETLLRNAQGDIVPIDISAGYDPEIGLIAFIRNISRRKKLENELRALANTDELTGLPNRRNIMARLEQELARLHRLQGQSVSLLMIDLDHFKQINDRFGHAGGDEILSAFCRLLKNTLRKTDAAGRIGGEEFLIMLAGTGVDQAIVFAEKFRCKVAQNPVNFAGSSIGFTISLGITSMVSTDATVDLALARADTALYEAKNNGRNRLAIRVPGEVQPAVPEPSAPKDNPPLADN